MAIMHEPAWHEPWTGEDARSHTKGKHPRRLIARIASGLFLSLVTIGSIYAGSYAFAALVAVMSIMMSWEWGGIVRSRRFDAGFIVHAFAMAVSLALAVTGRPGVGVLALFAAAAAVGVICASRGGPMSAAGVLYTGLPAIALVWFRDDVPNGFAAVLFIFSVVWAVDTAAYAAGKSVGGIKLWPSISPNKTWAGTCSGLLASGVVGAVFSFLLVGGPSAYLIICALVLGFFALAGDLAESALKRVYRLKDASNLIPGHGGFMDRLDGIAGAASVAAVLALIIDAGRPAAALLFGG